ncbi:DNA mismatch repair endonuclease MutL [bacterium]|nr:DNA mismatch repair endonuclease MutL [bacterium]
MADNLPSARAIVELAPDEVRRICAGEVIDRPLSVVKELIENSLDAGASQIEISLADGGRRLIRVSDNGAGIPFDELPLAVKPHCTSKIRGLDDIYYSLTTLGFRGEALSSIAAVSHLTLTSRTAAEELGGRLEVSGGALVRHERDNLQPGTELEVRDLFFNTPARLKFLKSRQSETSQISTLLSSYALAYPEVRWSLVSQDRTVLSTTGDGDLYGVLLDLLGSEVGEKLVPVDFEFPPQAVSGYISPPQYHRHNRQRQWYFINRRPVGNKLLYKAVDDAVREFLSAGKFPLGAFFLELPPEEIDVNVHPMKREVSFAQPQGIYSLLRTAVSRAVGQTAAARQRQLTRGLAAVIAPAKFPGAAPADDPGSDPDTPPGFQALPLYEEGQALPLDPAAPPAPAGPPPAPIDFRPRPPAPTAASTGQPVSVSLGIGQPVSQYTAPHPSESGPPEVGIGMVSQIGDSFLLAATNHEVYLIDQHAAHERILFEGLYARLQAEQRGGMRQRLLFPLIIELLPGQAELVQAFGPALTALGFACELGAGPSLVVREVPLLLAGRVTVELVHGVFSELAEQDTSTLLADQIKELAASLACRAAIKAGERLPPDECYALVQQLLSRRSSLSCPHGRPTLIRLGVEELRRMFLR